MTAFKMINNLTKQTLITLFKMPFSEISTDEMSRSLIIFIYSYYVYIDILFILQIFIFSRKFFITTCYKYSDEHIIYYQLADTF